MPEVSKIHVVLRRNELLVRQTWQNWKDFIFSWMILYCNLPRDQSLRKHHALLEWNGVGRDHGGNSGSDQVDEMYYEEPRRYGGSRYLADMETDHPGQKRKG